MISSLTELYFHKWYQNMGFLKKEFLKNKVNKIISYDHNLRLANLQKHLGQNKQVQHMVYMNKN